MTETTQSQEDPAFQERCRALAEVVERFLKRQASIGELRGADLAEACPSELAELQEQLEHWAGVVAARRRDLGQGAAAPAAALSHNAHWPDALERPLPPLEMSA